MRSVSISPANRLLLLVAILPVGRALSAQAALVTPNCANCAEWNAPQAPFRLFGDTYYVGTHGLSAILITSPGGHILIDGGLMESAPLIAASIRTLGFRLDDVRVILNSHVHYDHAGGIAALQRMSGAEVFASASSVSVLQQGTVGRDDPQFGEATPIAAVARVREIPANDTVRTGALVVRALRTAGHTPGGTSWSWTSCEGSRCLQLVYADSQSPISADDFRFSNSTAYPRAVADFEAGFATLEQLRCDVLITPHPDASGLWARIAKRDAGDAEALRDTTACVKYAAAARDRLATRLATERAHAPR